MDITFGYMNFLSSNIYHKKGFCLIELLISICIIIVIYSLISKACFKAKSQAQKSICKLYTKQTLLKYSLELNDNYKYIKLDRCWDCHASID